MAYPKELLYTEDHEWIKLSEDGKTALIGITDFAQDQLGDIVYIGLPEIEDEVSAEDSVADIESVKSVSDIFSPVTGVVSRINEQLEEAPELVNADSYSAWLFEVSEITEVQENTLSAEEYEKLVAEEA
ncbi:glycine cleavage system protein GcvH [Vagococcus sp. BWB3-3]|uniref:Glycine cleavage system H protein n=1 Tax=Vagococcus allomyrinae TaxID=2794353 RepID=A0A940P8Y2_9ENTE|nr:glycine cleavage system protein GcvH [Vagococcus allomyrinae]MBP1041836.1 glycine cleavage system protein GcvH [Vagococcus allomyrinae]